MWNHPTTSVRSRSIGVMFLRDGVMFLLDVLFPLCQAIGVAPVLPMLVYFGPRRHNRGFGGKGLACSVGELLSLLARVA